MDNNVNKGNSLLQDHRGVESNPAVTEQGGVRPGRVASSSQGWHIETNNLDCGWKTECPEGSLNSPKEPGAKMNSPVSSPDAFM